MRHNCLLATPTNAPPIPVLSPRRRVAVSPRHLQPITFFVSNHMGFDRSEVASLKGRRVSASPCRRVAGPAAFDNPSPAYLE